MNPAAAFPAPGPIGTPEIDGRTSLDFTNYAGFTASIILHFEEAATARVRLYHEGPPRQGRRADLAVDLGPLTIQAAMGEDLAETLRALADRVEECTRRAERGIIRDRAAKIGHVIEFLDSWGIRCSCGWNDGDITDPDRRLAVLLDHLDQVLDDVADGSTVADPATAVDDRPVTVSEPQTCIHCEGSGAETGYHDPERWPCAECEGTGLVRVVSLHRAAEVES